MANEQASATRKELLKASEAAAILRCTETHVRRMCKNGVIPAVKVGRWWRINADKLHEFAGLI